MFRLFLSHFLVKRSCEASETRKETTERITHAKKQTKFGLCSKRFELCHHVGCILYEFEAARSDNKTLVKNGLSNELAFLQLETDLCFVE